MAKKSRGFTLIELLVVIAIIGLLSSIVYTSLNSVRAKARIAAGLSFSQSLYHVLGSEAVGVWSFEDDVTDGQTSDGSGNGNNGTVIGATQTPENTEIPALRKALKFDGNDYVKVPNSASIDLTGAFSLEAWIKPENITSTRGIISKLQNSSNYAQYSLFLYATGKLQMFTGTGASTEHTTATGNNVIANNVWNHIAVTFNGSNTVIIYVNGVASATATNYSGSIPSSSQSLFISSYRATDSFFDGLIDEVRIYNSALSSAQIQKHYAEELGKFNLVKN